MLLIEYFGMIWNERITNLTLFFSSWSHVETLSKEGYFKTDLVDLWKYQTKHRSQWLLISDQNTYIIFMV